MRENQPWSSAFSSRRTKGSVPIVFSPILPNSQHRASGWGGRERGKMRWMDRQPFSQRKQKEADQYRLSLVPKPTIGVGSRERGGVQKKNTSFSPSGQPVPIVHASRSVLPHPKLYMALCCPLHPDAAPPGCPQPAPLSQASHFPEAHSSSHLIPKPHPNH